MSEPREIGDEEYLFEHKASMDRETGRRFGNAVAALRAARAENAALREWKEQAAPTLAASLATLQRVREALKKMRAAEENAQVGGVPRTVVRQLCNLLEEALGDEQG